MNGASSESRKNFFNGAIALTLSALLVKIIGVIYKVPLSYMLGDEGMGYFNSAYTVYGCFYVICAAGVPKAVSILTAEARARGDYTLLERIYKIARNVFLGGGFIFTLFLLFAAKPLSDLVGNSGAAPSVAAIAFSLVFIAVSGTFRGYLNGAGRQIPIAVCELIEAVSKLLVGLFMARFAISRGMSLTMVSAMTICGITFGTALSALYLCICVNIKKKQDMTGQKSEKVIKTAKIVKSIFRISVPIAISSFVMSITNVIDLAIVMRRLADIGYSELQATSLYGNYTTLAVPFLGLCIALVSPISTAALPVFSSSLANNDGKTFANAVRHTVELSCFIGAPLTFGFMFFSAEALMLVFPEAGAIAAAPHLALLAPSFLLVGIVTAVNTALEARGKAGAPLISMGIGALVKVAVSYALIGNPVIGISGAPIGTVAFYAVALFTSLLMLHRYSDIRIGIMTAVIVPSVNALLSTCAAFVVLRAVSGHISDVYATLVTVAVYTVLYLILSRFTVFWKKSKYKNRRIAQKSSINLLK